MILWLLVLFVVFCMVEAVSLPDFVPQSTSSSDNVGFCMTVDSDAIPFPVVADVIQRLEYASAERVMFTMLAMTGCRIRALDNMFVDRVLEGVLHWHEGKSTSGLRRCSLPSFFWCEIEEYRKKHDVSGRRLFGVSAGWFVKAFLRRVRPLLGGVWVEKVPCFVQSDRHWRYRYRLKGLRKNFQTLEFARQLNKWKDAGMALEMTSKQMKHSSARITAYHYIENFDVIDAERNSRLSMPELLRASSRQTWLDELGGG